MADFDVTLTPVKRASFDAGRKLKFWDDAEGTTAAVVKDLDGNVLTQPVKVPSNGHLSLRFDQWPVYYCTNRAWTRIMMVPGMPATISGLTQAAVEAAIGTGGNLDDTIADADVDTPAELAPLIDATNTRVNAISAKVDAILAKLKTAGVIASS